MIYWIVNTREGHLTALAIVSLASLLLVAKWFSRTWAERRLRREYSRGEDAISIIGKHAKQASMGLVAAPFGPLATGWVFGENVLGAVGVVGFIGAALLDLVVEPRDLLPPRWLTIEEGEGWQDAASRFVEEVLPGALERRADQADGP